MRDSVPIHLSPKAFDLLDLLVRRRPEAIAKAELHRHLWRDTFVADINLPVLIAEIRTALCDDARRPRFIRTLHRFGYAFCGTAGEVTAPQDPRTVGAPCWISRGGERLPLNRGENVVGRDPLAQVRIEAVGVSRRHAMIVVSDDDAVLHDLASKNGTYIGDRRVAAPAPLVDGTEIWFGPAAVRFHRPRPVASTLTVASRKRAARGRGAR